MENMKRTSIGFILVGIALLTGCSTDRKTPDYPLQGTWALRQVDYPIGSSVHYPQEGSTFLSLYDGDSLLRQCKLVETQSGLMIMPLSKTYITLVNKGNGEWLYLEEGNPRPLTLRDDSTLVIQRNGRLSTLVRADAIEQEWGAEIRALIDLEADQAEVHNFVLSAKERQQAGIIHLFIYVTLGIIVLLLFIGQMALSNRRERRRLQRQLQQIQEEHEERPQSVKEAIEDVVARYFGSEEYIALQRRISRGEHLHAEDWLAIEQQLKLVFPGFGTKLLALYNMSELESQTCLLIKLRIAPTDIANVLSRDTSTISTVRSRLYQKVFHQKGGAKEWDEFVLSIGE